LVFDVWNTYFGPIGVNLSIVLLSVLVFILGIIKRKQFKRETKLLEVSFLLFLAGVLYFTLHGRLLQLPFPVSIPERPLVDNNLTFNYFLTSLLTFIVFPVLLLVAMRSDISLKSLGLEVVDSRQTLVYASLGLVTNVSAFPCALRFQMDP